MGGFKKISNILLILSAFIVTFLGCDQIKAIGEYFKKPDQTSPTQLASSSTTESSQEQTVPATKPSPAATSDNIVARVGNWTITKDEFKDRLNALKEVFKQAGQNFDINNLQYKKDVLDELVRQQLLVEDAEKSGIANQKDIMAAVDEFKRTIIVREAAKKIIDNLDKVTDADIQKFYDDNKNSDQLKEPAQWHIREIVVDTQLKANELSVDLLKGTDFGETAKQNSKGKSAANGGDMGFLAADKVPAEMMAALKSLDVGGISSPFKGPEGFYIVKLEEKRGGNTAPFDKVKDNIKQYLEFTKQQESLLNYIEKLKQTIKVEINEKLLE